MVERVQIGEAVLYCGDSAEIVPSLGTLSALVADPPYGMAFRSNFRIEKHTAIANDEDIDSLVWACGIEATHSKYIFARWDNLVHVPKPRSVITWVKNNWSMGDLNHEHARQSEVALFYPGTDHHFPGPRPTDVIEAPRTGNEFHPTEKPVQLMMAVAPRREHSRKPDEQYGRIEAMYDGPRLEMFGRQRRDGWEIWGNQPDKFEAGIRRQSDMFVPPPKPVQASLLLNGDAA